MYKMKQFRFRGYLPWNIGLQVYLFVWKVGFEFLGYEFLVLENNSIIGDYISILPDSKAESNQLVVGMSSLERKLHDVMIQDCCCRYPHSQFTSELEPPF